MQGIFIKHYSDEGQYLGAKRPKTKKEVKETIRTNPEKVILEATSIFGDEYGGYLKDAPIGTYYVVGPDPYEKRNWYASVEKRTDGTIRVS